MSRRYRLKPVNGPTSSLLLRLALLVFVVAVQFYVLFYSLNGAQPNSFAFDLFSYSLASFSVALAAGGIVDLVAHGGYTFGWMMAGKTCASVAIGLALTFLSAPYPPYGIFQMSYTGYPMPFAVTSYTTLASYTSVNPTAFVIDCVFWIALVYPAFGLVGSALVGDLKAVGRLEGVGAAAFLTYGVYPAWAALVASSVFNSLLSAAGPVSILVVFVVPSALVGTSLAALGYRRLGTTVVTASVLFDSLLGLALLAVLLHVVL